MNGGASRLFRARSYLKAVAACSVSHHDRRTCGMAIYRTRTPENDTKCSEFSVRSCARVQPMVPLAVQFHAYVLQLTGGTQAGYPGQCYEPHLAAVVAAPAVHLWPTDSAPAPSPSPRQCRWMDRELRQVQEVKKSRFCRNRTAKLSDTPNRITAKIETPRKRQDEDCPCQLVGSIGLELAGM